MLSQMYILTMMKLFCSFSNLFTGFYNFGSICIYSLGYISFLYYLFIIYCAVGYTSFIWLRGVYPTKIIHRGVEVSTSPSN